MQIDRVAGARGAEQSNFGGVRHCDTKPEFTCRFRWEPGSIAFWDSRAAQHNPVNGYHGFRRRMQRITLAGDRPS